MGFNYRKSKKIGPFRVTVSKSGVSTSIGSKYYRVTRKANGKIQTTTRIPGTGISYTKQISRNNSNNGAIVHSRNTYKVAYISTYITGSICAILSLLLLIVIFPIGIISVLITFLIFFIGKQWKKIYLNYYEMKK